MVGLIVRGSHCTKWLKQIHGHSTPAAWRTSGLHSWRSAVTLRLTGVKHVQDPDGHTVERAATARA